ncbi:hypothetical protein GcM3_198018 [Golovinomyces cichoracearum]|uniref:Uncharacterized protein n=1 Tax=Golovinomyces cichoracearum TaxID=62708 RepID=A0A420HF62_9PEZI|nr:hypothetical protein GcM3_198018 [Golovinomyces cichoracearum]
MMMNRLVGRKHLVQIIWVFLTTKAMINRIKLRQVKLIMFHMMPHQEPLELIIQLHSRRETTH